MIRSIDRDGFPRRLDMSGELTDRRNKFAASHLKAMMDRRAWSFAVDA